MQRYTQNLDVSQELKKMLLEIGRKLFMTDEEYKSEVQEVSQEGFLRSVKFMKKRKP